jgi:hypothetical protein
MFATLFETTPSAALLVWSALKALAAIPFRLTDRISKTLVAASLFRKPYAIPAFALFLGK